MIEDTHLDPRQAADDRRYGEGLLYDFAKFLTGLSLLLLGGLLTLSQAARAGEVEVRDLALVATAFAIGGIMSFHVASAIVDARVRARQPPAYLRQLIRGGAAVLGVGTGVFLSMWLEALR